MKRKIKFNPTFTTLTSMELLENKNIAYNY